MYVYLYLCISTVKWDDLQKAGKIDIFETASNFFFLQSFQWIKNERALHFMCPRVVLISTQLVSTDWYKAKFVTACITKSVIC